MTKGVMKSSNVRQSDLRSRPGPSTARLSICGHRMSSSGCSSIIGHVGSIARDDTNLRSAAPVGIVRPCCQLFGLAVRRCRLFDLRGLGMRLCQARHALREGIVPMREDFWRDPLLLAEVPVRANVNSEWSAANCMGRDSRKHDPMTAKSHKRHIPFAAIFPTAAGVLPSAPQVKTGQRQPA
jgi:hypothetical protein